MIYFFTFLCYSHYVEVKALNFQEKLKELRLKRGFSQQSLAKKAGVAQSSINYWEKGERKPKLEQLRRIASALDVTIGELKPDWNSFSQDEINSDLQGGLPLDELGLLQDYRILNETGKSEARKRTGELTKIPEYRKDND